MIGEMDLDNSECRLLASSGVVFIPLLQIRCTYICLDY